jgi:hypothetical protein
MLPLGVAVIRFQQRPTTPAITGLFHVWFPEWRHLPVERKARRRRRRSEEGRRAFNVNSRRKSRAKKTEFQTGGFPGVSFRR